MLGALLVFGLGDAAGGWQSSRHYRPLLDDSNGLLASCKAARGNLEDLAKDQGLKLDELVLAGNERQSRAEQTVKDVQPSVQADYAAANRLQQERTGGDQC